MELHALPSFKERVVHKTADFVVAHHIPDPVAAQQQELVFGCPLVYFDVGLCTNLLKQKKHVQKLKQIQLVAINATRCQVVLYLLLFCREVGALLVTVVSKSS